jgi:hypothetical protein
MRASVLICLVLLLVGCVTGPSVTEPEPLGAAGQKWSVIERSPPVVAFFKGTFDVLNLTVAETGERFYMVHEGDRMRVEGGRAGKADLDVVITQAQVDAVARLSVDHALDEADAFTIMRILFSPVSRAFLTSSFLTSPIILQFAGVEDLIHFTFWTEGRPESSSVTLMAKGNHWQVIDGLEGHPKRVFRLNPAQTLDYMHHVHTTRKSLNLQEWLAFVDWYKRWREQVSFVPAEVLNQTKRVEP